MMILINSITKTSLKITFVSNHKNERLMSKECLMFFNKLSLSLSYIDFYYLKVFFILQGTKAIIKQRFCLKFSSLRTYPDNDLV